MLRRIGLILLLLGSAQAAEPVLDELGLQSTQTIQKDGYQLTTWRFKDSTGALGGSLAIPNSTPVDNYVVACQGKCPKDLASAVHGLPGLTHKPLPVLHTYMPAKGLVAHSERYVVGPAGLAEAAPQIPATAAAFQFGTEADIAHYRTPKGEALLALFEYPTPLMARQQLLEFQKISGAFAERSGPIVGVVLNAPDERTAATLLKDTEYAASLSWDEVPPLVIRPQTAVQIVLAGMKLSGFIMAFCLLSGLAFGAIQVMRRRFGHDPAAEGMIVLHLSSK